MSDGTDGTDGKGKSDGAVALSAADFENAGGGCDVPGGKELEAKAWTWNRTQGCIGFTHP